MMRLLLGGGVTLCAVVVAAWTFGWLGADGETHAHDHSTVAHPVTVGGGEYYDPLLLEQGLMNPEPMQHERAHHGGVRIIAEDLPKPSVTHLAFPDRVDGYNVQILTKDFNFSPESVDLAVTKNTGHAHIFVNGRKVARVYSEWYHLPASYLEPGTNLVTVTLNANDHSFWATSDGVVITSTIRVERRAATN